MTRTQKTLTRLVTAAATALLSVTCAPVDSPTTSREASDVPTPSATLPDVGKEPVALVSSKPDMLRQRIESAIDNVRKRDLLTTHGFWTVFHGMLGLGPSVTLLNPDTGERVNALDYVCRGGEVRGMEFIPTEHGLDVRTGPQFVGQGHQDQFVAELAQWAMPADRKFVVHGKDYTYMDFVRHTKARASLKAKQELSWAVLVLGQYLGTDITWTNSAGEELRFEDVLRYELNEPMDKAACGGTHRLFDLCWVHHLYLQRGGKTEGVWKDVADNTVKHQQLAKQLQNADGSFSTDFFRGRANVWDLQRRINTTGHIFEFLALSLPDAQLQEPWVQEAANALTQMVLEIQGQPMEGGTLYHAVHGLILYHARVYDRQKLGRDGLVIPLPTGEDSVTR